MSRRYWIVAAAVLIAAAGGWWIAGQDAPHRHQLVRQESPEGKVYWTCPMHPEVRQDEPGNCPICGMKLVKREESSQSANGEKQVLYWYDPMKPEVRFDQPGKSPFMDMDLVPKYADEGTEGAAVVRIDPGMAQNLGIRTAPAMRSAVTQRIEVVGAVEIDERLIYAIESRAAGWVERLQVRAVGDPVRRGQTVAGVYSPELYSAQEEFALAERSGDPELIAAARQRLALLGMSEAQIREVQASGRAQRQTRMVSPSDGVVTELNVREGQQVGPGMPLMRVADLSRVWVTVEIPEAQAAWVREGRRAQAQLSGLPGRMFDGRVDYVYPKLDTATRTVRARIVFENRDGALKPGMYANVSVQGEGRIDALRVPSEAVIRTGRRSVVIVAEGEGRFRPVHVQLGPEQDGQIVVLAGLEEGQQVVTSGQFLIDSEASLQGVYKRLQGSDEDTPTPALPPQGGGSQDHRTEAERSVPSPSSGEGQDGGER